MVLAAMLFWCWALVLSAAALPSLRDVVSGRGDTFVHPEIGKDLPGVRHGQEDVASYWMDLGQQQLSKRLRQRDSRNRSAKNVIFFLGDGMSIPTLTAARIYKGQKAGLLNGEEMELEFEKFPHVALSKTYCVDSQVADSACTATAYLGGVKANLGTIGVTPRVTVGDCEAMLNTENHVDSVLKWAQDAGKATGVVTTTRVTHASPAGCYAHIARRSWENDAAVRNDRQNPEYCHDIAEQLVEKEPGSSIKVILGGGRRELTPNTELDVEYRAYGRRRDGKNLIRTWEQDKERRNATYAYVWDRSDLLQVDPSRTDFLMGLFDWTDMEYFMDADPRTEPTLAEMTRVAIELLRKEAHGFFLFVEGGRIDHGHHETKPKKALEETLQFEEAVRVALEMTNEEETLIVVTADHAHTMSIGGYPDRGNDILGVAGFSDRDDLPYATLSYANGPGYRRPSSDGERHDIGEDQMDDKDYRFPTTVPLSSETHGGDDVAIFATGPQSHLFSGVCEENYIPHAIGYAACIGKGAKFCDGRH